MTVDTEPQDDPGLDPPTYLGPPTYEDIDRAHAPIAPDIPETPVQLSVSQPARRLARDRRR